MLDNAQTPLVIFSLNDEELRQFATMPDSSCRTLEGCYKGVQEPAFMTDAANFYANGGPLSLASDGQESILFLDNQRNAFLRFAPDYEEASQKYLGQWRQVTKAEALARDAWTRDPQTGAYWVAG